MADAARLHLHECFAGTRIGDRDRLDRDRLLLRLATTALTSCAMRRRVASPRVSIAVAARPRGEAMRAARNAHPATVLLGIAIVLWIVVFGVLVWRRHVLYGTIDFDLGIHDQSTWLLSRGHWFTTVRGLPIFGHHATFGYFLLVPFYWLGAGAQFINLLQVVVLALGAIPIYLLAGPARQPVGCADPGPGLVAAAVRAVVRVGRPPPRSHRGRTGALPRTWRLSATASVGTGCGSRWRSCGRKTSRCSSSASDCSTCCGAGGAWAPRRSRSARSGSQRSRW